MPASYVDALSVIQTAMEAGWGDSRVAYENVEPLDYSDVSRPLLSNGTAPYVAIKVLFSDSYAVETYPTAVKQSWGHLSANFYVRQAAGTKSHKSNLDALSALFEYKTIGGIVFKEMSILAPFRSEGWYVMPVMMRFYFTR